MVTHIEKLQLFSRYIGHEIWLHSHEYEQQDQFVFLTGITQHALIVSDEDGISRWIPIVPDFDLYEIKLLLKPLRMLSSDVKQVANTLPIQNFITQYYVQLGFDMPVFISPDHPANCKYLAELGLADYREKEEIISSSHQLEQAV